jgi:hypothetical protein
MNLNASKYQQFFQNLKRRVPKAVKTHLDRLKCAVARQDSIYDYDEEAGCKVLRNDLLAHAFAKGKPGFEYKERPECAAFLIEDKIIRLRRKEGKK